MVERVSIYNSLLGLIAGKRSKIFKNIDWYDLVFGLIQKDMELYNGENTELIKKEFKKNGFPVEKIKTNIKQNIR